jgi:hypothetical protein
MDTEDKGEGGIKIVSKSAIKVIKPNIETLAIDLPQGFWQKFELPPPLYFFNLCASMK